jgi:hypothetical protein
MSEKIVQNFDHELRRWRELNAARAAAKRLVIEHEPDEGCLHCPFLATCDDEHYCAARDLADIEDSSSQRAAPTDCPLRSGEVVVRRKA